MKPKPSPEPELMLIWSRSRAAPALVSAAPIDCRAHGRRGDQRAGLGRCDRRVTAAEQGRHDTDPVHHAHSAQCASGSCPQPFDPFVIPARQGIDDAMIKQAPAGIDDGMIFPRPRLSRAPAGLPPSHHAGQSSTLATSPLALRPKGRDATPTRRRTHGMGFLHTRRRVEPLRLTGLPRARGARGDLLAAETRHAVGSEAYGQEIDAALHISMGVIRLIALTHLGQAIRAGVGLARELLTLQSQGIPQSFPVTGIVVPVIAIVANLAIGHGLFHLRPWGRTGRFAGMHSLRSSRPLWPPGNGDITPR